MPRTLRPRQRAELYVLDVETAETRLVLSSKKLPIEAPTWARDGRSLVVSGDGKVFRVAVDGSGGLQEIPLEGVPGVT